MSRLYVYVPQWLATSIFCLNQSLLPAQGTTESPAAIGATRQGLSCCAQHVLGCEAAGGQLRSLVHSLAEHRGWVHVQQLLLCCTPGLT